MIIITIILYTHVLKLTLSAFAQKRVLRRQKVASWPSVKGLTLTAGPWCSATWWVSQSIADKATLWQWWGKTKTNPLVFMEFYAVMSDWAQPNWRTNCPSHKVTRHSHPLATWMMGVSWPIVTLSSFSWLEIKNYWDTIELSLFSDNT